MPMKKITLLLLAVFLTATVSAQSVLGSRNQKLNPKMEYVQQILKSHKTPQLMSNHRSQKAKATSNHKLLAEDLVSSPVTPPAGLETESYIYYSIYNDGTSATTVNRNVRVGFDGKDVYISGLSYYMANDAWVKGVLNDEGNAITFQSPQYYGKYLDTYDLYFIINLYKSEDDDSYPTSATVSYNPTTGEISFPSYFYILEGDGPVNEYSCYGEMFSISLTKGELEVYDLVTLPSNAEPIQYSFSAKIPDDPEDLNTTYRDVVRNVFVAFVGNDVYLSGTCDIFEENWVKGTRDGNKITFAANQFVGVYDSYLNFFFSPDYDVVFDYDESTGTLSTAHFQIITNDLIWSDYSNVVLTKIVEVAGTPQDPSISYVGEDTYGDNFMEYNLPTLDTNGNPMITSKLYAEFFYKDGGAAKALVFTPDYYRNLTDDLTRVRYDFTEDYDFYQGAAYLNMDISDWTEVGVKSIYLGGGEEHATEIQWYTLTDDEADGIESLNVTNGSTVVTYDLSGRKVSDDAKGLLIKSIRQSDGTVKNVKVLNR